MLAVDVVLLQLLVTGVPQAAQDPLHVQGVHAVRRHHPPLNLHKHQHSVTHKPLLTQLDKAQQKKNNLCGS